MTDPTFTCPEGHQSASADYCDTCGAPVDAVQEQTSTPAPTPAATPEGASKECPSCGEQNGEASLFCEACGYDFTTGQLPEPAPPAAPTTGATNSLSIDGPPPVTWVAELWVDATWYKANEDAATDPCPSAGLPRVVPLVGTGPFLIGRPSKSRGAVPQLDCSPDTGVSRRHAQLLLDQDRWYLEDFGSTNGSFVGAGTGPVPDVAVPSGQRREIGESERIYVGTWTRIVIRRATATEGGA
jgi:hypothetical protein